MSRLIQARRPRPQPDPASKGLVGTVPHRVSYRVEPFFALFRPLWSFTDERLYRLRGLHFTGMDGKGRETLMASDKREVGSSTLPRPTPTITTT
jgi:hypothetical protein